MLIDFKAICERDIDMLIMEEFVCNEAFRDLFYGQTGIKLSRDFAVCEAYKSLSDNDGESDVTFIVSDGKTRVAILIEDKIDAPTMNRQSERYVIRAEKGIAEGKYDEYCIFLVCPKAYWEEHKRDKNADYKYQVFYENISDLYAGSNSPRDIYKYQVIQAAVAAKKKGYQVVENEAVTKFWKDLREFCAKNDAYRNLIMLGGDSAKGSDACWPEFQTSLKNVKIVYKSDKGYVDLQFAGYGNRIGDLREILIQNLGKSFEEKLDRKELRLDRAEKSAVVRISNPDWNVSFKTPFSKVKDHITGVFDVVKEFTNYAEQLNYNDLY